MGLRYVTVEKFAEESGYTVPAIRTKIARGVWIENLHWRRAPDGRNLIDTEGVQKWVEGQLAPSKPSKAA